MPSAASIRAKVDAALGKLQASPYAVYKRVTTSVGGNPLTGAGAVVSSTDTLLVPTPAVEQIAPDSPLLTTGESMVKAGDWAITASAKSLSMEDLDSPSVRLVLAGASNNNVLRIVGYSSPSIGGAPVAFMIFARSIKR